MTERIIQPDTWGCFACVAAMITGESLDDVYQFIGHDGSDIREDSTHPDKKNGFGIIEIVKYLVSKDYFVGSFALFDPPVNIFGYDEIQFSAKLDDCPGMVVVESARIENCNHVIYWDSKQIFDPSPLAKECPEFSDYKVLQFIPVIRLGDK